MLPIEEYLQIGSRAIQKLEILEKYMKIADIYTPCEIKTFYSQHAFTCVDISLQKIYVTEILDRCENFVSKIDTQMLGEFLCNWFILKNSLLTNYGASNLSQIDFLRSLDSGFMPLVLIKRSPTTIDLINTSQLLPFMVEYFPGDLKLNKNTFKYVIGGNVNIPELMAYVDLDIDETKLLMSKISSDAGFASQCKKFIADQGILNRSMQIIASLCDMTGQLRNVGLSDIASLYCKRHIRTFYIPFKTFKPVESLSRLKAYLLYLSHRDHLNDDIEDMIHALKSEPTLEEHSTDGMSLNEINDSTLFSLSPLDTKCNLKPIPRSIQAEILNLILKTQPCIKFEASVFKYLPELWNEEYFERVCVSNAREILESRIFVSINNTLCLPKCLATLQHVFEYLRAHSTDADSRNSQNSCEGNRDTQTNIPDLVCFKDVRCLTENDKGMLMEAYIYKHTPTALISNLLEMNNVPESVKAHFLLKIDEIADLRLKKAVINKLKTKNVAELNLQQQKKYYCTEKVSKTRIRAFLSTLNIDDLESMIAEIDISNVTTRFIAVFIEHVSKKYEFSFIFRLLEKVLELKNLEVVKAIQKYLFEILNDLFINEEDISMIEVLYSKMLDFRDPLVRRNNDQLLIMIGKSVKLMDKNVFIGNIKQQ